MAIESDIYPGYYIVPGFNRYVISKDGVVIDKKNGNTIKQHISRRGYYNIGAQYDCGKKQCTCVHRLLAMTFIPLPDNKLASELDVNHIDGDKLNNTLSNLEWCTHGENMQHAFETGLMHHTPLVRPVILFIKENKLVEYPKLEAAAQALGLDKSGIRKRLKAGPDRVWPGYIRIGRKDQLPFKYMTNEEIEADLAKYTFSFPTSVQCMDIRDESITNYSTITETVEKFGNGVINNRLQKPNNRVWDGYYRFKTDCQEWSQKPLVYAQRCIKRSPVTVNIGTLEVTYHGGVGPMTKLLKSHHGEMTRILDALGDERFWAFRGHWLMSSALYEKLITIDAGYFKALQSKQHILFSGMLGKGVKINAIYTRR